MCKNEHCYDLVNVDGLQLVIEFNAKSKMLLKPLVGATILRNGLEQKAKMSKFVGNPRQF